MDDRRFDSLAKALAGGASRRTVLKGILGLGGAAVVSGTLLEGPAEAAKRPTPTPKPVTCPGNQTWNGTKCVCPAGLSQCVPNGGPACCNPTGTGAAHSECCDNACCVGHCYGEELCCPYPRTFCEATHECCPIDQPYCCGDGCCSTPCCNTTAGSVCCEGSTPKCCPNDVCIPANGCCTKSDCPGCQSCVNHICVDDRANCPGGTAGCDDCNQGNCVANNGRCNDGNPCNDDICTVGTGQCSHPFNCHGQASCCDDGNPCTSNICNANGTCSNPANCNGLNSCCDDGNACTSNVCNENGACSYPFNCNGSNACCDDGNACTQNICNANGTCSNPFYCTSDACCTGGQVCNLDTGACYTPCAPFGEPCAGIGCCSADNYCYSLDDELSICGPCIPDGVPCGLFCQFCCAQQSYLGFCVSCGLQFASCQDDANSCCDGFYCQYSPITDNFCTLDI